ncbi:VWA domain-containing protein [bacterium]
MLFANKLYLLFLILIPIFALLFIVAWNGKKKRLSIFGDYNVVKTLIPFDIWERQKLKLVIVLFALLFLIIGLAGPQFGTRITEVKRKGVDVVIAIDTSLSMLAEDIKPDRMSEAKRQLGNLIKLLEGNRVGIIAFAGTSFLQCPLTLDLNSAKLFLDFIDIGIVPQQGTELGSAIRLAAKTFHSKERKHKALVILTDGEDHESQPIKAAEEAKKEGVKIFTIGFGRKDGEVIPLKDARGKTVDYKKDRAGKTVVTKLDENLLKRIAMTTGGKYYYSSTGLLEIEKISDAINSLDKKDLSSKFQSQYEPRFYYFVIIGFLLLLFDIFFKESKYKTVGAE